MTEKVSARIYQFPVGGRAGEASRRYANRETPAPSQKVRLSFGGAWYHEEAIRDEERLRPEGRPVR